MPVEKNQSGNNMKKFLVAVCTTVNVNTNKNKHDKRQLASRLIGSLLLQ